MGIEEGGGEGKEWELEREKMVRRIRVRERKKMEGRIRRRRDGRRKEGIRVRVWDLRGFR